MRIFKALGEVWFVIAVIAMLWALAAYSRAAVMTKHENSLGVVQYTSNPLMYVAGSLASTSDAVANVDGNLNLRVKPLGTYMLYDESILFCGMPLEKFRGAGASFVLTYKRAASRSVRGIGCHELLRVDALDVPEAK